METEKYCIALLLAAYQLDLRFPSRSLSVDAEADHHKPHSCWLAKTSPQLSLRAPAYSEYPSHLSCKTHRVKDLILTLFNQINTNKNMLRTKNNVC